jgi:hypothetical protein
VSGDDGGAHRRYNGATVTDFSAGAGPDCPCDGTTRTFSVVLPVAARLEKACNFLGSGTAKVASADIFIPGIPECMLPIIGPKNAMVPA